MTSDKTSEPSQTTGQFHSVKGTVVETIGNITGADSLRKSGRQEHADGEAEITAARAKGYVDGATDQLVGRKDAIVGAVTGDKQQETAGNVQHDKGKLQKEINQ